MAVFEGHDRLATWLLEHGAAPYLTDTSGFTLRHLAARKGRLEVMRRFLESGAELHAASASGFTPLDGALAGGHRDIEALLRANGATRVRADGLDVADEDRLTSS